MQSLHVHFWHHCNPQSRLHNMKEHTLQERSGFPLKAFTLGKTSRHKHKSRTHFLIKLPSILNWSKAWFFFHCQLCFNDLTVSISMADDWSSISFLSAAPLQVNRSYMSNRQADQTFDQKWEDVVGDECFDCSEAVGMAALCVADDFKAAPSTALTRAQAAAHRHWPRCSSPSTQGPLLACRSG